MAEGGEATETARPQGSAVVELPKVPSFTVEPVKDSFRRMLTSKPSPVGAGTKNRVVVAPFSENVPPPEPSSPPSRATSHEPIGGHAGGPRKEMSRFREKGLAEQERLQRQKRRLSYEH